MTETRTITLAGESFAIPPLPLRANMLVYPLCRKLSNAQLIERSITSGGILDCTADEMADLASITFEAVCAGTPSLTRDAFDALAIAPPELLDAFFTIRYQTGAWIATAPAAGSDPEAASGEPGTPGEAKGAKKPPKSTSAAS